MRLLTLLALAMGPPANGPEGPIAEPSEYDSVVELEDARTVEPEPGPEPEPEPEPTFVGPVDPLKYKVIPAAPNGYERLRQKGHRLFGAPSVRADSLSGIQFGLRSRYIYRKPEEARNTVQLDVEARLSTKLVQNHELTLRLRDLTKTDEVTTLFFHYNEVPVFGFFGVANDELLSSSELDTLFYRADVITTGGEATYQQPVWSFPKDNWRGGPGQLRVVGGYRFDADLVRPYPGSFLDLNMPETAGWTRRASVVAGLSWDGRTNEWSPRWGGLHDVSVELAAPWLGSSSTWVRFNATGRWYRYLGTEKIIFGQWLSFDAVAGRDIPLYTMGEFGGFTRQPGWGGRMAGRGYYRRRFISNIKAGSMTELRFEFIEFRLFKRRYLGFGFRVFADVGKLFVPGRPRFVDHLHPSGGLGIYIIWDRFYVFRFDLGFGPEGARPYLLSNHPF